MAIVSRDMLRQDVEQYYEAVAAYIPHELAERGDERFWLQVALEHAGARALELGAGTGRVSALLARHAHHVVALDVSPDMLRQARKSSHLPPNVSLLRADMRQVPFHASFDLVVCADDPFSHLTDAGDRLAAMRGAAESLKPGGIFVLDALWFPPPVRHQAETAGRHAMREVDADGHPMQVIERWTCDAKSRCCTARYQYVLDGRLATRAEFQARHWSSHELQSVCAAAGLGITHRWGDYQRSPWHWRDSQHLLVRAEKLPAH